MLTLAQWIARLTKGYIKFTGKQPDNLAKLKIKMEALQKVKDQKKVVDLRGDVLDPSQPILGGTQSGTKLSKEFQAGIMRATKSKPTELKLDKLRKDVLKEIENRKKEDYIGNIIDPEDYGFSVSDGTWTDEVEELMQMLVKDNLAGGGLAGMLGERPGYESGRRAGPSAARQRKAQSTDWYTDKIIRDNMDAIREDMSLYFDEPKTGWEAILEGVTDEDIYGEYDEKKGYTSVFKKFFETKDGKKYIFEGPGDKGINRTNLLEFLDKSDEGGGWYNVKEDLKKVLELKGGGLAPMLGEPTYQDEDHRVPFSGGKLV